MFKILHYTLGYSDIYLYIVVQEWEFSLCKYFVDVSLPSCLFEDRSETTFGA